MVKRLPSIENPTSSCESYILGKDHREKFIYGVSYREKVPLDMVHTYLCGPMKAPYFTSNVYFMSFIDDYSQKTWVYLLKQKS